MSTEPGERRRRRELERRRAPDDDGNDVDPAGSHHYTWQHYLALAAIACVLGFLIWSLTTSTSGPGAASAGTADPTMSSSAPPSTPRGEP